MEKPYLSRLEAAEYCRNSKGVPCSPKTLQKLVTIGGGPDFLKFGNRALYTRTALDEWVSKKLREAS